MSEDGAAEAASLATQPRPDGGRPQTGPALALTADTPDVVPAPVAPVAGPVSSPNVGDAAAAPTAPDDTAAPVMLGQGSDAPAGTALTGDEAGLIAGQVISGGAFSGIAPDELPASPLSGVRPVVPVEIDPLAIPEADSAVALPGRGVPAVAPDAPDAPAAPEAGAEPDAARAEPAAPAPLEDSSASAGETRDQAVLIPTDRLPQAGRAEAAPGPAADPDAAAEVSVAEDALTRNAADFEVPADKPVLSIVLLDTGEPVPDLPFQASFALDPLQPGVLERARAYRAAGHEILVLPRLPEGASATDAAQSIEGSRALLGLAVALTDSPEGALQVSRDALTEIVAEAAQSGHALLTFPRGLNGAQRVAQREGVVTGVVFRDIDGAGQDAAAVKRFLDQAAFRARQEGAVIVFARARPETMAGLAEWVLGNRAQSVALAPVSVALKAGAGL